MLDRIEKIQWVFSGLAVAAIAALFCYPGLSTPVSDITPPAVEIENAQAFIQGISPEAAAKLQKESQMADVGRKLATGVMTPPKPQYFVVRRRRSPACPTRATWSPSSTWPRANWTRRSAS